MKQEWRGYSLPADQVLSEDGCAAVEFLLEFLTDELQKLTADQAYMDECESAVELSRGDFWNVVNSRTHKPHLTWGIPGPRAKYYRMIQERIRVSLLSLHERQQIARVCESFEWDTNRTPEIRDTLSRKRLYPTSGSLRNTLASGKIPSMKTDLQAFLDYTVSDRQAILDQGDHFDIEVCGEWFRVEKRLPDYARAGFSGKISKPVFQWKDGQLIARFAYQVEPEAAAKTDLIAGVDLGKVKAFALSVIGKDGSHSLEKGPSRELERLNEKVFLLRTELKRVHVKKGRVKAYLEAREDPSLLRKWEALDSQSRAISSKLETIKEKAGWLVARDVVAHLKQNGVGELHLENLSWLDSKGGKWDFAAVRTKIEEVSRLSGITVHAVDANLSSKTDPFTDERVIPRSDRTVILSNGESWDRDHAASTEIARRPKGRGKAKVQLDHSKCRDKTGPTPKRPKQKTRRRERVELARIEKARGFGSSIVVANPAGTRAKPTPGASAHSMLSGAQSFKPAPV